MASTMACDAGWLSVLSSAASVSTSRAANDMHRSHLGAVRASSARSSPTTRRFRDRARVDLPAKRQVADHFGRCREGGSCRALPLRGLRGCAGSQQLVDAACRIRRRPPRVYGDPEVALIQRPVDRGLQRRAFPGDFLTEKADLAGRVPACSASVSTVLTMLMRHLVNEGDTQDRAEDLAVTD